MANLAGLPWIFAAADAGATLWWPTWVRIDRITWANQGAAGDSLVIKDRNGITRFQSAADTNKSLQDFGGMWINGFQLSTMTSGSLSVWVK